MTIEKQNEINIEVRDNRINHPIHYNQGVPQPSRLAIQALANINSEDMDRLECIQAMLNGFTATAVFWFCVLSAFKYLWRAGLKGAAEEDYAKSRWHLMHAIGLKGAYASDQIKHRVKLALEKLP